MYVLPACFNMGDVLYLPFDTYDTNGASVTMSGLAVTDIEIYKNGSVTQRSSDNGYALLDTDGIDFDSTTGLHGISIDTGDNSDSGFWADGNQYWININAITVDSQTVRFTYYLPLGYSLRPTTKGRQLDVSSGGEAGVDWANVGTPGSTVSLSATTVATVTTATTATNLTNAPTSGDLTSTMKASVNAEVLDVLNVDTFSQPGQATPAATTSIRLMLAYLYKAWRNRSTQTTTAYKLYNDDTTTVDQKATTADDGTTFSRTEIETGP